MTIPQTIPLSSIDLGLRERTDYRGIEDLAESLEHNGLIQPVVLSPVFHTFDVNAAPGQCKCAICGVDIWGDIETDFCKLSLIAGGRRLHALRHLGVTELHHGVTSTPGTYGFLLKGEPGTELTNLLTEIAENLDRENLDWRDECRAIVRAAKLIRQDAHAKGHMIVLRDLGAVLGCGYHNLKTAEAIHEDLVANPQDYKEVTGLRAAMTVLLKKNTTFLQAEQAKRLISNRGQAGPKTEGGDVNAAIQGRESSADVLGETATPTVIPLTSNFHHTNGLDWMFSNPRSVDHIICDPDFAISKERLEAGSPNSAVGVVQATVSQSLCDLENFLHLAYETITDRGFLVFFYDLDHHEKCQTWATAAGFSVQRWPLIWHKTDYRSNASPQCNFTKNIEYAMVCRKGSAVLAQSPQPSSIFAGPSDLVSRTYGHPFAKPHELWTFIYRACCLQGQSVLDPFVGSGSSVIPALAFGLHPVGCEVQEQHYNSLLLNLQSYYKKTVGPTVLFA